MKPAEFQNYKENKNHTDRSFPYNTYLCSIPLDFPCVPYHWHDEAELIVIQKGTGMVKVDFHSYTVHAGSIIVVLPGHLHAIEQIDDEKMEYENILFRGEMLLTKGDDLCTKEFLKPMFDGTVQVERHIHPGLAYYNRFSSIIKQMDMVSDKRPCGYQLILKGSLYQLMFLLIENQKKEHPTAAQQKSLEKINYVVRYVHEHYSEPLTVSDMAALCHYSESHFMKFFKNYMKISFVRYLNEYRLTMAHRLLQASDDSVLDIAEQCGFENLSYFNRLFKQKYGVTPRQIR